MLYESRGGWGGRGGGQFVGVIIITWDENRRTFDWQYIGNVTLGIWSQGLVARVEIKKKKMKVDLIFIHYSG